MPFSTYMKTFPFKWNIHTQTNQPNWMLYMEQSKNLFSHFINGFLARASPTALLIVFCFFFHNYLVTTYLLVYLLTVLCCDSPSIKAGIIYKLISVGVCFFLFPFLVLFLLHGIERNWNENEVLVCVAVISANS